MPVRNKGKRQIASRYMMNVPGLAVNIRPGELHGSDLLIEGGELIEAYVARRKMPDLEHAASILALACLCVEQPVGLSLDWYCGNGSLDWLLGNAAEVLQGNAKVPSRLASLTTDTLSLLLNKTPLTPAAGLVSDVLNAFEAVHGLRDITERRIRELRFMCTKATASEIHRRCMLECMSGCFWHLVNEALPDGEQRWFTGVPDMKPKGYKRSYREMYAAECKSALAEMSIRLNRTGEHDETVED